RRFMLLNHAKKDRHAQILRQQRPRNENRNNVPQSRFAAVFFRGRNVQAWRAWEDGKAVSVSAPEREHVRRTVWQGNVLAESVRCLREHFRAINRFWPEFNIRQVHAPSLQSVTVVLALPVNELV